MSRLGAFFRRQQVVARDAWFVARRQRNRGAGMRVELGTGMQLRRRIVVHPGKSSAFGIGEMELSLRR